MNIATKPNLHTSRVGLGGPHDSLVGLDALCAHAIGDRPCRVLEIGSKDGVSTALFAWWADTVVAVDPLVSGALQAVLREWSNIQFVQDYSYRAVAALDGDFDLVYIDGEHDYASVARDIAVCLPKVKTGGWLCGHDYCPAHTGVMAAVDELVGDPRYGPLHQYEDSSWAIQVLSAQ